MSGEGRDKRARGKEREKTDRQHRKEKDKMELDDLAYIIMLL